MFFSPITFCSGSLKVSGSENQAEAGVAVNDLCREHGFSKSTFYKWKAKYGGIDLSPESWFFRNFRARLQGGVNSMALRRLLSREIGSQRPVSARMIRLTARKLRKNHFSWMRSELAVHPHACGENPGHSDSQ